jgi:serine protease AprX
MNATKLHASLAAAVVSPKYADAALPVILKLRRGPIARGEMRALAKCVPEREYRLLHAQALKATPETIAALSEDPAVELIWPDLPVHAWLADAVPLIHAARVWESGFTGQGVRIAVLDTGLDGAHPDFAGRITAYRDFIEPDDPAADQPRDPNGHGTHVAGIAAGGGVASGGRYRGVAPDAELVIGRVLDAFGNGRTSDVMAGVEWAVELGAKVINISLGGPPFPSDGTDALSSLCNAAVEHGTVVCVAAGNLGPNGHTIGSPGAATQVITVGACEGDPSRSTDAVATFSSRGPTADGRVKPDLVFPGMNVVAPRAAGTALGAPVNDDYTSLQGTSQATPMATGTAALVLQSNPRLTPEAVRQRLVQGAHRLAGAESVAQGSGRGDAYNALIAAAGTPLGETEPAPPVVPAPEQPAGCLGALGALLLS